MDIVVKGRKTEVPERFRKHVAEKLKLDKIQKFDGKVISLDVEVSKEPNPVRPTAPTGWRSRSARAGRSSGRKRPPHDPYAALDLATGKLEARLRKQHDKRYSRRGNGRIPAAEVAETVPGAASFNGEGELVGNETSESVPTTRFGSLEVRGEGPLVMREKTHIAAPMSLDQALYEMELVGHDFYLFVDSETKEPSVVYRRHAYDYGVIHLRTDPLAADEAGGAGGALGG